MNSKTTYNLNTVSQVSELGTIAVNSAHIDNQLLSKIEYRKRLYALKDVSSNVLDSLPSYNEKIDKETGEITVRKSRTWYCSRIPIKKDIVKYVRGASGSKYFANLQHCASYWVCPVCAYKIEQVRTNELYEQLKIYESHGYVVYFITLTFPHYQNESLKENLDFLIKGWDYVRSHKGLRHYGKVPYMRSLEITYGANGFHPHIHAIVLTSIGFNYVKDFKRLWLNQLQRHDKKVFADIAFKAETWKGKSDGILGLAKYVGKFEDLDERKKWGVADEMVRGQRKKAKKGYTPFQILGLMADGQTWDFKRSMESVYAEYADTIKRKRMMQPSRGFFTTIRQISDAEAVQDDKIEEILFTISYLAFRKVIKENKIQEISSAYELGGMEKVKEYIGEHFPEFKMSGLNFFLPWGDKKSP